ncbi:hypothetical protein D8M15_04570 [Micrococcus sp. HSID17228]|nr:hypothetical protein D8M29_06685 [Micrococcus sp. HSID17227]RUQ45107.1 hypothetical protein D8M15_04570 [Micrococcus sp. HSID17228]
MKVIDREVHLHRPVVARYSIAVFFGEGGEEPIKQVLRVNIYRQVRQLTEDVRILDASDRNLPPVGADEERLQSPILEIFPGIEHASYLFVCFSSMFGILRWLDCCQGISKLFAQDCHEAPSR